MIWRIEKSLSPVGIRTPDLQHVGQPIYRLSYHGSPTGYNGCNMRKTNVVHEEWRLYRMASLQNGVFIEWRLHRMVPLQNGVFIEWCLYRMASLWNGVFIEWRLYRMASLQNGVFIEWRLYRMVSLQNGVFIEWCIYRMVHLQNGVFIEWCLYRMVSLQNGVFIEWRLENEKWWENCIYSRTECNVKGSIEMGWFRERISTVRGMWGEYDRWYVPFIQRKRKIFNCY